MSYVGFVQIIVVDMKLCQKIDREAPTAESTRRSSSVLRFMCKGCIQYQGNVWAIKGEVAMHISGRILVNNRMVAWTHVKCSKKETY